MMSEKRFEVDVDHLLRVWDTEKNKRIEIEDIVELLNKQQATINNQEQKIRILQQEISDTQKILEMLTEKLKGWNDE